MAAQLAAAALAAAAAAVLPAAWAELLAGGTVCWVARSAETQAAEAVAAIRRCAAATKVKVRASVPDLTGLLELHFAQAAAQTAWDWFAIR